MSDQVELQDFFFGELNAEERAVMEKRLQSSEDLREQLRRLELTSAALRMLPEEEPSQRIAFISDKVFQPSWAARLREWVFGAGPVLASAALSGLVVFAVMNQRPVVQKTVDVVKTSQPAQTADVPAMIRAAVAESEARNVEKTRALLAEADRRHEMERKQLLLEVQDTMTYMQKKMNVLQVASNDLGGMR